MRKGALQLKLAGVVNGVAVIGARGYTPAKIRIIKEGIHVRVDEEMLSTSTDVSGGEQKTAGELPLDVEIPLMRERVRKMGVHGYYEAVGCKYRLQGSQYSSRIGPPAPKLTGRWSWTDDVLRNPVGRTRRSVVHDIGEESVIENAIARSNNSFVAAKNARPEARRVGKPYARRKIILVPLLLRGKNAGEGRTSQSLPEARIEGGELQIIPGSAPVFIAEAQVQRKVLLDSPSILNVGSIVRQKRMNLSIPEELCDGSTRTREIVNIVRQAVAIEAWSTDGK